MCSSDLAPGPAGWTPAVDILETSDQYLVTAEVPGISRDDLDIRVHDGRLTISGVRRERTQSCEQYHREIGEAAGRAGFALLACVGADARWIAEAAEAAGMPADTVLRFSDAADAAARLPAIIRPGDLVLVKASRSIHLELVANALSADPSGAPPRKIAS